MNLWQRIKLAVFWNRYDATQYSTSRSWRSTTLQDARLDLTKSTREVLQAKSRDYERNSPLYTKLADTWEQYTVGTGIQFSSASSDPVWNLAADLVFSRWNTSADLQSRFGFDNLQGIISRSVFVDGEIFVLLTREGPYARIQLIEAHRCKTPPELSSEEGRTVCDGVAIDSNGRPTGYWFLNGEKFTRTDAVNVIHVFEPARPGQFRGIPYCTAALNVLHDLEDLRLLEMRACKDSAELSTVIKTANGEMPSALVSMAQKFSSVSTASGTAGSVTDARRDYYQTAVGGRTLVAQTGDDVAQHVPERPGANTREYWRLLAADVCAAAGIPLALVYPDSMQGTVYRGALDASAAFFRCKTAVLATYFRRIRNYAIRTEAAFDRTIAKLPDDWTKTSNGSVRAPNVDIGRNSTAMLAELSAGTRTFTGVAAELGLDGKQILREKADEAELIRKLAADRGIDPSEISNIIVEQPTRSNPQSPDPQPDDATA
jgi:capsid protein